MTDLSALLGLSRGSVVSLVGAGGKTTTMFRLARELHAAGLTVVTTTTTNIQRPGPAQSPLLVAWDELEDPTTLIDSIRQHGHVTVVSSAQRTDKLAGVDVRTVAQLTALADVVLVEADGARHKAIKAPASHEPVVPEITTHFLSVAGLHALGQHVEAVSHRPEIVARIAGQEVDAQVTVETIARLLAAPNGGLKGKPETAQAWAVLTHLTAGNESQASEIAACLVSSGYTSVVALSAAGMIRPF